MLKSYKYRIYPSEHQKVLLESHFDGSRFIYNLALETKIQSYLGSKKNLTFFDLSKQTTEVRNSVEWLKRVHSQVLQCSVKNLDTAYNQFFKGRNFPKFKSKKDKQSIQITQHTKVDFNKNRVFFPNIKWIDCIFSRQFEGKIKTCTITKTKTDKYFISIMVDNQDQIPNKKPIISETSVGIDVGIKTLLTFSDGKSYPNLNFLKKNLKKLRIEQRKLSRRFKKGAEKQSNSWIKQKKIVALLHEKIANQRLDYLHKITTEIIRNYDTIVLEDLDITKMMKNPNFALAIADVGWGYFNQLLAYKAEWYGKNIIKIGRFEPSSKICSDCGIINKNLTINDRIWTCKCGKTHDRDQNAAINIKNMGLGLQPLQAKTNL